MTPLEHHPTLAGLRESLCHFPSGTFPEVLLFVTFAVRCVREAPPGFALSASGVVADPRLRSAFEAAERWLSRPSPDALLLDASDVAIRAAAEAGGPSPLVAIGVGASAWAVACAVSSAAYAAMIGASPEGSAPALREEEDRSDASRYALLAATCAVQAADAGQRDIAVEFQRGLIREVWSLPLDI